MSTPRLIVGTAGHVDHGKTALVRRLTGVDLDSLPEERSRGITIALGFAPMVLPDGTKVALVDVPGHERLVRTMISGATGIDAVLLCVSAVDGVMPQTREHLAILELLGVKTGLVALTMADLVDEELLELAREDVLDAVEGTFLAGAPVVPCSAMDGRGLDDLTALIAALSPRKRPAEGPFRMPVDRAFSRSGFGTVATGTTWSGVLNDGDTVSLLPSEQTARVRGIQVHGEAQAQALPGQRTALNLAGVDTHAVPRGTVLARGHVACTSMIDVQLTLLHEAPELPDGASVRVLLGTAERLGRLHLAADAEHTRPGDTFAQLRLEAPLPCLPGDHYILRRVSPVTTLGGGVVVDPWAPRMRHNRRVAWGEQLERLHRGDESVWLERAGEEGLPPEVWAQRAPHSAKAQPLGDRLFAPTIVARLQGALLHALTTYHQEQPLSLGAHRRELRRGRLAHLSDKVFDALVDSLSDTRAIEVHGAIVRVAGFEVQLTERQLNLQARVLHTIDSAGLDGVRPKVLHETHQEPEVAALVRLLESEQLVAEVSGVGWVSAPAQGRLLGLVRGWFGAHERLSPGDFKELTGLTRRAAIPTLEWLDSQRITQRQGNGRVAGPAL